jgi:hypothetical protein
VKSIPFFSAVVLLVAATAAAPTPMPTAAPVALQYDQITRMIAAPATPPPPGSFGDDYQAALLATPNPLLTQMNLAIAKSGNRQPTGSSAGIMSMMTMILGGHPTRYAFYYAKGWIRTDDVVAQTATISKCDEHTMITLDLAKKTYAQKSTQTTAAGCSGVNASPSPAPLKSPGTEDLTIVTKTTDLGPKSIDGIDTTGASVYVNGTTTNATGSCKNVQFSTTMVRYASKIGEPRAFCPLPQNPLNASDPVAMFARAGCKPTIHMTADASALSAFSPGNLALYQLISMTMPEQKYGFNIVTERGHVAWLDQTQADALFTVPPDFTLTK